MLTGEFQHNMDAKGRVTIPSRFRDELGEKFYVSRGLDNCLTLYSQAQWEKRVAEISAAPGAQAKDIRRFIFASTEEVFPDKQGRILLSSVLRSYAGLTKDVTVIGAGTVAEIWDTERWQVYQEKLTTEALLADMNALQI